MADEPLKHCASCGESKGFTDLPKGSHARRWEGSKDRPMTKCNACGAWFPQTSINKAVRKGGD